MGGAAAELTTGAAGAAASAACDAAAVAARRLRGAAVPARPKSQFICVWAGMSTRLSRLQKSAQWVGFKGAGWGPAAVRRCAHARACARMMRLLWAGRNGRLACRRSAAGANSLTWTLHNCCDAHVRPETAAVRPDVEQTPSSLLLPSWACSKSERASERNIVALRSLLLRCRSFNAPSSSDQADLCQARKGYKL